MLLKNSIIFGATMVLKGALSFALIAIFTRLLSADSYGDYAIIIALVGVADVFGFMWIRHAIMRHITDEQGESDKSYFTNAIAIYAVIGAFTLIVSWLLNMTGVIDAKSQHLLYELLGLIIAAEALSNIAILMARLRLKLGMFFTLSIIKPILALGIGSLLILNGHGVNGAIWALLGSCLIASALGLIGIKDFRHIKTSLVNESTIKAILTYGLPLIAALSIQSAVKVTDRLLLEGLIGGDITGLYAAAQDIPYKLLTILISAIHLAGYPLAVKALEGKGEAACREQLKTNCAFLAAILFPAALAIGLLAPQLAHIFLGQEFRPFAAQYFAVFAGIAALSCAIQYYFILSCHLSKKTNVMIIPFLIALAINFGTGFILIPTMAEQGAIWGSALAYGFLLIASIIIGMRIFPMPLPICDLRKIILATALMGAVIASVDFGLGIAPLLLYTILGGGIYLAVLTLLNPMNIRQHLKTAIKR